MCIRDRYKVFTKISTKQMILPTENIADEYPYTLGRVPLNRQHFIFHQILERCYKLNYAINKIFINPDRKLGWILSPKVPAPKSSYPVICYHIQGTY